MKIGDLLGQYRRGALTPRRMIDDVMARIAANRDSNSWLHLLERQELYRYADRLATLAPDSLPLYGVPFAIKDNIDLGGAPTTAACPAYRYLPERSAFVVQRLIDAGAIPIGKTNLDQFATGLVGTRSPHGTARNPYHADYIPGGSSSGSAAAVAAGEVAFALGTDTAGSGRVPAAFTNLFGVKPTRGLLSTDGVVPACRSLDCVSIFARDAADSGRVLAAAAGYDPADPWSRREAPVAERAGQWPFVFGVPRPEQLRFFGNSEYERLFATAVDRLEDLGGHKREIDFDPFAAAARLLYEGPWVAERYAALAEFIARHPEEFFPVTYEIIAGGTAASAVDAFRGMYRLQELRRQSETVWGEIDCLVTPTAGTIYRIDEVVADPLRLNANLGYYTNFMNLLDLAALAVPAGFTTAGLPFGITLAAPAFSDYRLLQLGERFAAAAADAPLEIAVCGAHMRGLPLNRQLVELGGRFLRADRTAPAYRLFALATDPPKPGLLRSAAGGAAIELEVWQLPAAGLGRFLAAIPAPLGLGKVELADGRQVTGFLVEAAAVTDAREITACGGWRRFIS
ncbi:allophanate hydrolase [Geotalea uraniireducens]|uniref:Allophanate hydrolase n=1 Tax=Geotalea uraniireducens TaxID=351604 RepID=A0ABN6VLY6_9BACT|nr:allophanate hydrolase [Geotalea uraniireducens]BDV41133.1 allophanate hydrolase [Geotalea uraniireducens]